MAGGAVPANLVPIFRAAAAQNHIAPAVLAGMASVETNLGRNRGPSSTGAVGLMQFEPGTARSIGINPTNDRQAIFGAARLLNQYGYQSNPLRAIGAYNGGPGNPQMGYARQVMSEAQRLSGQLGAAGVSVSGAIPGMGTGSQGAGAVFDSTGYQQAQARFLAGSFVKETDQANPYDIPVAGELSASDPLLSSGVLSTTAPNPAHFLMAQSNLQALAGTTALSAHPAVKSLSPDSNIAGGFLPKGATYIQGRKDQGRDGQTNPGGPILAPGAGYVVRIGNDPGGFGPKYPIVHFTTGPFAGRTMYIGHTLAQVTSGSFKAGQVLSYTGTHGVGNATVPGWFEIGYADSGSPGPMGQATPF